MKCWILSTPRTGGNYLSMLLNECLGRHAFDEWLTVKFNKDTQTFLSDIPDTLNIHYLQMLQCFGHTNVSSLTDAKFIILRRKDFHAQVASFCVAKASRTWRIYNKEQLESYHYKKIEVTDETILDAQQHMLHCKEAWKDTKGLEVFYEELDSSPESTLNTITNYLGIECDVTKAIKNANDKYKKTLRPETQEIKNRLSQLAIRMP